MAVYAYCRQSSGSNTDSVSIDQQIQNCELLAKSKNLEITKIFSDYNTSGRLYWLGAEDLAKLDVAYQNWIKDVKKVGQWRIGLGNLLNVLKKNDIILVDDKTRLARSLNGSYLENCLIQILIGKNVKLISNKEGEIDFNNFGQKLVFNIQSSINSDQIEIQRQKCRKSLKMLKDNGDLKQSLGMALGYKYTGKKKEVEIDNDTAPIVKFIFSNYIKGKSLLQICRDVDKIYHRSICVKSIKNVINRPQYAGYQYNSEGALVKSKQVEGKELVSFSDWKIANDIMNSRKTNNIKTKIYPLHYTGLIRCGYCNSKLTTTINNKGKYFSYRCMSHTTKEKPNCKVSITANTLYTNGLSLEDGLYPILIIGLLKRLASAPNTKEEELNELKVTYNNLLQNEKKISDMFLSGLLDSSTYETILVQQKDKKQELSTKILDIENELKDNDLDKIRVLTSKILNKKLSFDEYQELIPYSIKNIITYKEKITINTIEGEVNIPRFKERGILRLPQYIFNNTPNKWRIYYYKNIPNIYAPKDILFQTQYLTIYYIGE